MSAPPDPRETPATPDLSRKVLGYRQFTLDEDGQLGSVATRNWWMPGPNRARCDQAELGGMGFSPFAPRYEPAPDHDAPNDDCVCGLYAWHALPASWLNGTLKESAGSAIAAVVTAWGRLEVHRDGFRAEWAEIVALIHDPYDGPVHRARAQKAADLYGVKLLDVRDVAGDPELAELGDRVPEQLMPDSHSQAGCSCPMCQAKGGMMTHRLTLPPPFLSGGGPVHYGTASFGRMVPPPVYAPLPVASFIPPLAARTLTFSGLPIARPPEESSSPPPMTRLYKAAIAINGFCATWNAVWLIALGRTINLIVCIVNTACVAVLLTQRRRQCRRYRKQD